MRGYLMAHSGGTYLGIKVIEKHPQLYQAYIGVAQISYQNLSEKKAYEYILQQYKGMPKNYKTYQELLTSPVELNTPLPETYIKHRDAAMHDLGVGTMRTMNNVITGLFIPSLFFSEYSFNDKINLWRGKESVSFEVPMYFFHGIFDYTCSYELAKEYYKKISAPTKMFYSFLHSAHSPIFEEPAECVRIIESEILNKQL